MDLSCISCTELSALKSSQSYYSHSWTTLSAPQLPVYCLMLFVDLCLDTLSRQWNQTNKDQIRQVACDNFSRFPNNYLEPLRTVLCSVGLVSSWGWLVVGLKVRLGCIKLGSG